MPSWTSTPTPCSSIWQTVDLDDAGRSVDEKRDAVGAAAADLTRIRELLTADPDAQQVQIEYDDALARYEAALEEVRRAEATGRPTAPLRSLSESSVSAAPSSGFASSGLTRQLLSALLIAAVLGIGAAYAWEALDHRLADAQSVGRAFGVPILTEVPDGGKGFAGANALAPPASVISEAYRRLRTILRIAHGSGPVVVLVTSPGPSEGKTTTVAHLARALGEVGSRVLAVSADFRKPQLHRYFDVDATPPGITSGGGDTRSATSETQKPKLIQETAVAGVSIATAGLGTADPTNLIHYARRLIAAAKGHYDYVLIDTSPLLSANDALDFVDDVDAVILIAKFGATTRPGCRTHPRPAARCRRSSDGRRPDGREGPRPVRLLLRRLPGPAGSHRPPRGVTRLDGVTACVVSLGAGDDEPDDWQTRCCRRSRVAQSPSPSSGSPAVPLIDAGGAARAAPRSRPRGLPERNGSSSRCFAMVKVTGGQLVSSSPLSGCTIRR